MGIKDMLIIGTIVKGGSSQNVLFEHQWLQLGMLVLRGPTFNIQIPKQTKNSPIGILDKVCINVVDVPSCQEFAIICVLPHKKAYLRLL